MLMLLDVTQDTGLLAKFIKTAKGSFKRLIVANLYARQKQTPPFVPQ